MDDDFLNTENQFNGGNSVLSVEGIKQIHTAYLTALA
jgi:hypothetical protein